eukprot:11179557-Lingulodinium_polyedra.AAC.1
MAFAGVSRAIARYREPGGRFGQFLPAGAAEPSAGSSVSGAGAGEVGPRSWTEGAASHAFPFSATP